MLAKATMEKLLAEWTALREQIAEIERAEHPDITDRFGRVWVWWKGDLYRHCGHCIPGEWITSTEHPIGLPSPTLADNPNYQLCEICRQEWPTSSQEES